MLNTIIIHKTYAGQASGKLIGQMGNKLVLEVETLPNCPYRDANGFTNVVSQRCLPGNIGNMMTIADIQEAKALIEEMGDYAKTAQSLNELRLMKQATDAELALVTLYEEVISNG
jgi:GH24 family phage-related lysozyme (muramidase)